jgi:hypothetical protein
MHTFEKHGLMIFHNNDLRSTDDVHLQRQRGAGFTAPQQALVAFVAQLVASARISELEQAEPLEVLGFRGVSSELLEAVKAAADAMNAAADAVEDPVLADELEVCRAALIRASRNEAKR